MSYTAESFLKKIKPLVIADMKKTGILASLTAAQAFIESNKGNSGLTTKANNLFGIKGQYQGASVKMLTTEYYNGVKHRVYADFRKYPSWDASIADHSAMFNRMARYKNLRGCTDYKLACKRVKEDGYATSPTYTQTLISCIEKYKLYEWDNFVIAGNESSASSSEEEYKMPTIKRGSEGRAVSIWQIIIDVKADGIFGAATQKATKAFQSERGLASDGIVGPKTWKAGFESIN